LWSYSVWTQVSQAELLERAFAWSPARFTLGSGADAQFIEGLFVSGSYFEGLGVRALLGRTLVEDDDRRGADPVAVISYGFWRRRFGSAADAIGRTLTVQGTMFTVVGVLPSQFFGAEVGRTFDAILPLMTEPLLGGSQMRMDREDWDWLTIMARLRPGQSLETTTVALRTVQPQIREATLPESWRGEDLARYLRGYLKDPFTLIPAATGVSSLRRQYMKPLLTLMVVVTLVLLIACANVANLLLARAIARRHEFSVRLALGATRSRLIRQLLSESILLAAAGTALGTLMAVWASQLLVQQLAVQTNLGIATNVFLDLSLDWRVLLFMIAVMVTTTLLCGTVPAIRTARVPPIVALKAHGRGTEGDARTRLADGLVIAQVMLSVVLVVAAGLFGRTFGLLATRPLGFDGNRVLVAMMDAQRVNVSTDARIPLYERARERVRGVPGVAEAALSIVTPVSGMVFDPPLEQVSGTEPLLTTERVFGNYVSPGWFKTYGIPLITGRDFTEQERSGSARVAIVNDAFARKFLGGTTPLGRTMTIFLRPPTDRPALVVVGIVGNSVYRSIRDPVMPVFYVPLAQFDVRSGPAFMNLSVRSSAGSPSLLIRSVATAVEDVSQDLALTFRTLDDQTDASLARERVVAALSGIFGVLALILAAVGLYGMTSYSVMRRYPEMGIRLALGATPAAVVRLVVSRVLLLVVLGAVLGIAVSIWLSPLIAALLYGVSPRDPATLVAAAAILSGIGAVAGWIPARRASRTPPAAVMRHD
jgi:predicted permease